MLSRHLFLKVAVLILGLRHVLITLAIPPFLVRMSLEGKSPNKAILDYQILLYHLAFFKIHIYAYWYCYLFHL
jgi:hypothetical protein